MVKLTTGRKAIDFVPYGNWCGIGGSGKAVDPIDKCCQTHDNCYMKARDQGKCKAILSLYLAKYNWKSEKDTIVCSIPEDGNECDLASCYCDREVALCLGKNIDSYRKDHKFARSFGS
nr:phospholipase A2 membrane associated-like protein [Hemiscorpius lepturus]